MTGNLLEDLKQVCLKQGKNEFHAIFTRKNGLAVKASVEIDEKITVYPKQPAGFQCMVIGSKDIAKFTVHRNRIIVTLTRKQTLTLYLKRDGSYYRQRHLQSEDLIDKMRFMLEELTPRSLSQRQYFVYLML